MANNNDKDKNRDKEVNIEKENNIDDNKTCNIEDLKTKDIKDMDEKVEIENLKNNNNKKVNNLDKISSFEKMISNTYVKIASVVFIAIFTYLFMSYGWKYMGFQMTTEPDFVSVFSAGEFKPDNVVFVSGKSPMSIGSFAGAVTKVDKETGTLYVGVRFNLSGNNTEFRVVYPQDEIKINRIVLKKNESEKVIWERAKGE